MGQEFAFIFDIIIISLAIGMTFVGIKKGFTRVILEMLSLIAALVLAFLISEPIANGIYGEFIEKPLEKSIDENIGAAVELIEAEPFGNTDIDFDKIKVSDVPVGEIVPDYHGTGLAVMDLFDVDFSETGIENMNLGLFGIPENTDFSSVNAKTADFSMAEIEKYGLGKLITAQYLASSMIKSPISETLNGIISSVKEHLPMIFTDTNSENANVSSVRTVVMAMFDTKSSVKTALMDGIISPSCIIVIRSVAAIILFALFMIILSLICRAAGWINKIPVLGKVNALLGGAVGLCESAVISVLICIAVKMIVSMFGGTVIMFNETAINSTFVFKYIYYLDILSF